MKHNEKRRGHLSLLILLLSFLFVSQSSCGGGGGGSNNTSSPQPSESELAAMALLRAVVVSTDAEISFFGPVLPGTILWEAGALGENTISQSRGNREFQPFTKRFDIPSSPGKYYVFFINDRPIFRFAHPVRYVWVNLNTLAYGQVNAEWWPLIEEPGAEVALFSKEKETVVAGVRFFFGKKNGIVSLNPNKNQMRDAAEPVREDIRDSNAPAKKIALIMDGGGMDGDNMSQDADRIANEFLSPRGFTVQRISQYNGNSHPYLPTAKGGDLNVKLMEIMKMYAGQMQPCTNDGTCHEFFLYIAGHAKNGYINFHSPDNVNQVDNVSSTSESNLFPGLKQLLSVFDKNCVKLIVFLDVCQAGKITPDLKALCEGRPCGVTLITSTDEKGEAPAGNFGVDTATHDFLEDVGDLDGDKKVGDLGDRVKWMLSEGKRWGTPTLSRCPEGTPLCSTD